MKSKCPYDDCQKHLSSKFNLQRHIDTCHLRIKRFECAVCFKRFASKQNLREHEFIHGDSDSEAPIVPHLTRLSSHIEIPKLSALLSFSNDLTFRPYLHVTRIYPYPVIAKETILPDIISDVSDEGDLPKLCEVIRQ